MSTRITLDSPPEFFTNLGIISGQIILHLLRPEQIGGIIVKLEGEANTSIVTSSSSSSSSPLEAARDRRHNYDPAHTRLYSENHKILYKVQQVFPDEYHSSANNPFGSFPLQPGQHQFPFKFQIPINNACSDSKAMTSLANQSLSGAGMFGSRGMRLMDGTRQLYLRHVTQTLPPSLSGMYKNAEIRYYIKVTVQRPGFLKENWRFQLGFKFMPIEPPRKAPQGQEAFARRPFTFTAHPSSPSSKQKNSSLFGIIKSKDKGESEQEAANLPPPSVEMSARLPHPLVLTCNRPVPLRLIAKKLQNNPKQVYLSSFQMDLIGTTTMKAEGQSLQKSNRWVIASNTQLDIPLVTGAVGSELIVPDGTWCRQSLPNTVAPSFTCCNISRSYEIQILLTLGLGARSGKQASESITLPLHFANVAVYSGITPPPELVAASSQANGGGLAPTDVRPQLPPRESAAGQPQTQAPPLPLRRPSGQAPTLQPAYAEEYEDAPPSYSEAMAESTSMSLDQNNPRPPFSGVTAENAPPQLPPQKN